MKTREDLMGLSAKQQLILVYLDRYDQANGSTLLNKFADKTQSGRASLSRSLARLEERGLIERNRKNNRLVVKISEKYRELKEREASRESKPKPEKVHADAYWHSFANKIEALANDVNGRAVFCRTDEAIRERLANEAKRLADIVGLLNMSNQKEK